MVSQKELSKLLRICCELVYYIWEVDGDIICPWWSLLIITAFALALAWHPLKLCIGGSVDHPFVRMRLAREAIGARIGLDYCK